MKPRTLDALLLVNYGNSAMFALELINGSISLTVNNGDGHGPFTAYFNPENGQNFCDGEWHSVTAVKSQYVITLIVDKINSRPTIGGTKRVSTETSRPIFVGGHPRFEKTRGLTIHKPFIGCMRNFKIREIPQTVNITKAYGQVHVGVCPLF